MTSVAKAMAAGRRALRDQNVATITVARRMRAAAGGGFVEVTQEAGPFQVRVYRTAPGGREETDPTGVVHRDGGWGIIGGPEVDLRAGPDVDDEFDLWGLRFRVRSVVPVVMGGMTIGIQGDLEVIG
jgi:hypothetical protein